MKIDKLYIEIKDVQEDISRILILLEHFSKDAAFSDSEEVMSIEDKDIKSLVYAAHNIRTKLDEENLELIHYKLKNWP